MLREFTLLLLLVDAGLLIFADLKTSAALLLLIAALSYVAKRSYSHVTGKEFSYLAAKLTKIMLRVTAAFIVLVGLSSLGIKQAIPFYVAMTIALVPVLVPFVINNKTAKSSNPLAQFRVTRILRCLFVMSGSLIFLIVFGLIGLLGYHLLPAITLNQIIALNLVMLAPLYALQYDKNPHKSIKATDHNFRSHTMAIKQLKSYLGFGLLAALITYANYILLFTRHGLNPYYLDPTLPLYHKATALALATLTLCMFLGMLFERVDRHDFFINEHTLENKKLMRAFGLSIVLLCVLIYTPGIRNIFQTNSLDAIDWLTIITAGVVYSTARMINRHSRKYSRQAVLKLHKRVNS